MSNNNNNNDNNKESIESIPTTPLAVQIPSNYNSLNQIPSNYYSLNEIATPPQSNYYSLNENIENKCDDNSLIIITTSIKLSSETFKNGYNNIIENKIDNYNDYLKDPKYIKLKKKLKKNKIRFTFKSFENIQKTVNKFVSYKEFLQQIILSDMKIKIFKFIEKHNLFMVNIKQLPGLKKDSIGTIKDSKYKCNVELFVSTINIIGEYAFMEIHDNYNIINDITKFISFFNSNPYMTYNYNIKPSKGVYDKILISLKNIIKKDNKNAQCLNIFIKTLLPEDNVPCNNFLKTNDDIKVKSDHVEKYFNSNSLNNKIKLTKNQIKAIAFITQKNISIIQGPPGMLFNLFLFIL